METLGVGLSLVETVLKLGSMIVLGVYVWKCRGIVYGGEGKLKDYLVSDGGRTIKNNPQEVAQFCEESLANSEGTCRYMKIVFLVALLLNGIIFTDISSRQAVIGQMINFSGVFFSSLAIYRSTKFSCDYVRGFKDILDKHLEGSLDRDILLDTLFMWTGKQREKCKINIVFAVLGAILTFAGCMLW